MTKNCKRLKPTYKSNNTNIMKKWRRIQDQNPHFLCDTPLIFIKMGIINKKGAICYCEGTTLIRPFVNIQYLTT
jgi:CO dehydrogenase nickel-insertion accessory protein CooC1